MSRIPVIVSDSERLIAKYPAQAGALRVALDDFKRTNGHFKLATGDQAQVARHRLVETWSAFSAVDSASSGPVTQERPPQKPVTIVARTDDEALQGFWGRCVHDMSGFIPPSGPILVNYNHNTDDAEDVIGVVDQIAVVDGQLIATSRLIPFTSDDIASQLIAKGEAGIPYQASIELDSAGLEVAEVPTGITIEVNDKPFTGPGVVFTQWSITGLAITPNGADSSTSVQFNRRMFKADVSGTTDVKPAAPVVASTPEQAPPRRQTDAERLASLNAGFKQIFAKSKA